MSDPDVDRKLLAAVERLGRAIGAARRQAALELGLSLLGLQILDVLADGRPRRIGRLAGELDVTQPTASEAVATLVQKGLVARERDPDDGRAVAMRLTADGRRTADAAGARLAPVLRADVGHDRDAALRVVLTEIARLHRMGIISVTRDCLTCDHYAEGQGTSPARCRLLERDLPDHALRVDCPEHSSITA